MIFLQTSPTVTIAVDGEGLLRFAKGATLVYAQKASLHTANGVLVNAAGLPLVPKVSVKGTFSIGLDGTITCAGKAAGRIVLAKVVGTKATLLNPGEGLAGVIRPSTPVAAKTIAPRTITPKTGVPKVATLKNVAPKSSRVAISVRPESQIEGDRILLGSIAEITGPEGWKSKLAVLDLGKLPPLGTSRAIGAAYVRALVRGAGLKADSFDLSVPGGATVGRIGVVIEAQTIFDEALKGTEGYVPAPSRIVPPMTVPVGALQLSTNATARGSIGISVVVTATVDGKPVGTRTVALVPDPNVPTVKIGDAVRLRLISGGATIEVPGKVKTAGRQGSDITVVTSTGSVHTGRLLPNGLVEVRL